MMLLHFWQTGVRESPVTVSARCTSEFRSCGCGCRVGRSRLGTVEGAGPSFGTPGKKREEHNGSVFKKHVWVRLTPLSLTWGFRSRGRSALARPHHSADGNDLVTSDLQTAGTGQSDPAPTPLHSGKGSIYPTEGKQHIPTARGGTWKNNPLLLLLPLLSEHMERIHNSSSRSHRPLRRATSEHQRPERRPVAECSRNDNSLDKHSGALAGKIT